MPRESHVGELRRAAQRLRDVAPDITGPLRGLADPVAEWLDHHARAMSLLLDSFDDLPAEEDHPALRVARTVNGDSP